MTEIRILPLAGIPEVTDGDDVAALLVEAAGDGVLANDDVVVVAHKIVSKSEGRVRPAAEKEEMVASESARVLRRTAGGMWIGETRHGFVCANAGIDASNVPGDNILLLPVDPDLSARRIRSRIRHLTGADVAVIVSDTFGRAWRIGQTNVAIGVAGMDPFLDHRGEEDRSGMELGATNICIADELAGAAEMVMGKTLGIAAALIKGSPIRRGPGSAASIVRSPAEDLFR
ncbi:MAG: coenzyme F420-0:L-glutamate ligase [Actinobacteria bacterium]|nr:coenzyme F420-0:L-glutamate ligase [Actinomycetota bacterium]